MNHARLIPIRSVAILSAAAAAALLMLNGCSTFGLTHPRPAGPPIVRLRAELSEKFDDPNFFNANWGVLIQSLKTGEVVYERNKDKCFMPASNMKLFTTSAALTTLTPDYRYRTTLTTDSTIEGGHLRGNLWMHGAGDPSICGRFNGGNVTQTFEQWADSLKALGVSVIDGGIIGDDNSFDEEYYGDGWDAGYETDWYAAQIGGIVFNDNCVDMTVTPADSVGKPATITWNPDTKYITVINETMTVPPDSNYYIAFSRDRGTNVVHVRGRFPINKPVWNESIAIDNPTLYAVTVLKETLEKKGITVTGSPKDIDDITPAPAPSTSKLLATYSSPNLAEIVKAINKPSQNLYAEQLFRTMGLVYYGKGGMRTGRYVANPVYDSWGMDTTRMEVVDGCGLSRLDLVSPANIVELLTGMYRGPYFDPFYASLPIAGVDGSLRGRMRGTAAEGNVHAKTGFIGYVRSLSGYVTSADGEMFVFSMMANHYTVSTSLAERIQNDVCLRLASFSRKEQ